MPGRGSRAGDRAGGSQGHAHPAPLPGTHPSAPPCRERPRLPHSHHLCLLSSTPQPCLMYTLIYLEGLLMWHVDSCSTFPPAAAGFSGIVSPRTQGEKISEPPCDYVHAGSDGQWEAGGAREGHSDTQKLSRQLQDFQSCASCHPGELCAHRSSPAGGRRR